MGRLSSDLKSMGFSRMEEDSPVSDDGRLWSNSTEIVCDETGIVIDGNHHVEEDKDDVERRNGERVFRYQNSENVKMIGGYIGSYFED